MADIRRNQRDLTADQKAAFVKAVLALKNDVDSVLHPGAQKRYDDYVEKLRKALLIFHSPGDEVVGIENASRIFAAARHPKSFVSLAGADHLLSERRDADLTHQA